MSLKIGGGAGVRGSLTSAATRASLVMLAGTGGPLHAVTIKLYTDGPTPNSAQALGDFTEATFTGYAPVTAAAFGVPSWEGDYAQMNSLAVTNRFAHTGGGVAETIKGFLLTDAGTPEKILYAEDFGTPKEMAAVGDVIDVIPEIRMQPTPV